MSRTDGNHASISQAAALAHVYHCHDCGTQTEANLVKIKDRQTGRVMLLSATAYDPVFEDELICGGACESHDLAYVS